MTDAHLIRHVGRLAGAPRLLVGSDFDGTLSVLCDRPDHAVIEPRARQALESLAELPRTSVAVISGRTRAELVGLVGCHAGIQLIGAHGAERAGVPIGISDTALSVRGIQDTVAAIVAGRQGFLLERKPTGVTLHYRLVRDRNTVDQVMQSVLAGPAAAPGVRTIAGKEVLELTIALATKGSTVRELRRGVTHTLFLGDDITDEDAFAVLGPDDVGVKVGDGATRASHRVAGVSEVAELLETLARLRTTHR